MIYVIFDEYKVEKAIFDCTAYIFFQFKVSEFQFHEYYVSNLQKLALLVYSIQL